jgi:hypothetical protein
MFKPLRIMTFAFTVACVILGAAFDPQRSVTANNSGAPAMRTGSPGDTKSCTTCHAGVAQTGSGIITTNVPPTGYVPGNTYNITANCVDAARTRFGFEISPQNPAGLKLGIITITDPARTKLVGSGKYITHTAAGTAGSGSNSWSFNWTAPPAGTGDVTFYGAFNFSNHNNASSGDVIKLDQVTVQEDLTTWTETISEVERILMYPNPVNDFVNLVIPAHVTVKAVRVYTVNGSLVQLDENMRGENSQELDLSLLESGSYFLSFETDKSTYFQKLIKL